MAEIDKSQNSIHSKQCTTCYWCLIKGTCHKLQGCPLYNQDWLWDEDTKILFWIKPKLNMENNLLYKNLI